MLSVSDVVAVACRAAADAGIRSVCVTNFRLNQAEGGTRKTHTRLFVDCYRYWQLGEGGHATNLSI
ncbi:putative L-arabinokinase [Helianthus anomalus]